MADQASVRPMTQGPKHHFFGYYGVDAWDPTIQHHLALETDFDDHRPLHSDVASVGLVDRDTGEFERFAQTSAFNLQQGSMMHWIDARFGAEFTYNDWEGERLVSRALNPETHKTRTIDGAVAAISPTEPIGLGLNFARMAHCRAVVGYDNEWQDEWVDRREDDGLHLIDFRDGSSKLLLSIADVASAFPEGPPEGRAWFNHVYFNTNRTRILFLYRAGEGEGIRITSMWTVNTDGSDLELQIPAGKKTSHFAWRDTERIMASSDVLGPMQFVEFRDRLKDFAPFGGGAFPADGHNAFSPDRNWVVCDTYPRGEERMSEIMLYEMETGEKTVLGNFHSEPQYTKDIRCDLHPRWSPDGKTITFDTVHGDTRQIWLADVEDMCAS